MLGDLPRERAGALVADGRSHPAAVRNAVGPIRHQLLTDVVECVSEKGPQQPLRIP
jgi:hypothetical protein